MSYYNVFILIPVHVITCTSWYISMVHVGWDFDWGYGREGSKLHVIHVRVCHIIGDMQLKFSEMPKPKPEGKCSP